jgi:hypothetical protein
MPTLTSPLFDAADPVDVLAELRQIDDDLLAMIGVELERALDGDPDAVRVYVSHYRVLSRHVAQQAELEWTAVLTDLLANSAGDVPFLPWFGHFALGDAVGLALVSRARELLGSPPLARDEGDPQLPVEAPVAHRFIERVRHLLSRPEDEDSLQRLMDALVLSKTELGGLFGVTRQAVDRWWRDGVPADRQEKLSVLLSLVDLLERKLKPGRLPGVARRAAPAYDGRTMLDLIRENRHAELLESTRSSLAWHVSV